MTSLRVICAPPIKNPGYAYVLDHHKNSKYRMDTNAKSNMLNLEKEDATQSSYFALTPFKSLLEGSQNGMPQTTLALKSVFKRVCNHYMSVAYPGGGGRGRGAIALPLACRSKCKMRKTLRF